MGSGVGQREREGQRQTSDTEGNRGEIMEKERWALR